MLTCRITLKFLHNHTWSKEKHEIETFKGQLSHEVMFGNLLKINNIRPTYISYILVISEMAKLKVECDDNSISVVLYLISFNRWFTIVKRRQVYRRKQSINFYLSYTWSTTCDYGKKIEKKITSVLAKCIWVVLILQALQLEQHWIGTLTWDLSLLK